MTHDLTKYGMSFMEIDKRSKDTKIKNNLDDVLYVLGIILMLIYLISSMSTIH